MESGSQPTDGPGSGGVGSGPGRPINPATQRPVRETEPKGTDKTEVLAGTDEPFNTDDLRRWEDQRISQLNEQLVSLSAALEGQGIEIRAMLRNELIMGLVVLLGAGAMFGIARELMKMKEAADNATQA